MAGRNNLRKKSDFDTVVSEVAEERNAAPKMGVLEDEYEMLAGYKDENGVLHNTFVIRPMNGEDEEALARFKNSTAAKLISAILERCVISIGSIEKAKTKKADWHKIIENLYVADQDYILMRIRETSIGEELKTVHKCPECGTSITTALTVDELKVIEWDGEEGVPFELPRGYVDENGSVHKTGIIRYPRGIDREVTVPIAVKNAARGKTLMLTRLTQFDDDVEVNDKVIKSLTMGDRNYLQSLLNENQFGLDMSIEIECPECGNVFNGGLNATNFI